MNHSRLDSEHKRMSLRAHSNKILTLMSYNFCISILIVKLEMTIGVTHYDFKQGKAIHNSIYEPVIVCGVGSAHNRATYLSNQQSGPLLCCAQLHCAVD